MQTEKSRRKPHEPFGNAGFVQGEIVKILNYLFTIGLWSLGAGIFVVLVMSAIVFFRLLFLDQK